MARSPHPKQSQSGLSVFDALREDRVGPRGEARGEDVLGEGVSVGGGDPQPGDAVLAVSPTTTCSAAASFAAAPTRTGRPQPGERSPA